MSRAPDAARRACGERLPLLSLSLKAHPVSFLRESSTRERIVATEQAPGDAKRPTRLRRRPGARAPAARHRFGVIFATLEDETGVANIIVWPKIFERFRADRARRAAAPSPGRLQSEQGVIHVVAERLQDMSPLLSLLSSDADRIKWHGADRRSQPPGRRVASRDEENLADGSHAGRRARARGRSSAPSPR